MAETHGVLLGVAYDGARYSGLTVQDNAPTVGEALLAALRHIDPTVAKLRVSSRTDAGVHARDQRVAFDSARDLPMRAWVRGVLPHLPDDIAVLHAARVPGGFNPRFETQRKHYRYVLLGQHAPDPFWARRSWRVGPLTDPQLDTMRRELEALVGTHDFAGFASARDERERTERTMDAIAVTCLERRLVAIDISGDGFLHNMVRIITGTAVDIALGRLDPGAFSRALASHARSDLGMTAPPDGLYLERVELRDDGTNRWPPA